MRFVYFFFFILIIAGLSQFIRANPAQRPKVWFALGLSAWLASPYHLLFNLWPGWNMWSGYVKGLELTFVDMIAFAILVSGIHKREPLRFRLAFLAYFVIVISSTFVSTVPSAAWLYVWQISRMALICIAITRSCADERAAKAIMFGMVLGMFYNSLFGIVDHAKGALQSGGLMGHQNLLGLMSHFVALPALALVLGGSREKWLWLGPLGGLIIVVVGGSRATTGLALGAYALLFMLSSMQGWNSRKAMVSGLALIGLIVAAPLAVNTLNKRFEVQEKSDYDERAAFKRAASMMIADHPFGVGANQYTLVANVGGYSQQAGVVWNQGSRAANVHNIYYLYAAETGWLGALAFILLLANAGLLAFKHSWKRRNDWRAQMLLGLAVGIATTAVHSMYEWIMTTYTAQNLLAIDIGLIAGLSTQIKRSVASEARARRESGRTKIETGRAEELVLAD